MGHAEVVGVLACSRVMLRWSARYRGARYDEVMGTSEWARVVKMAGALRRCAPRLGVGALRCALPNGGRNLMVLFGALRCFGTSRRRAARGVRRTSVWRAPPRGGRHLARYEAHYGDRSVRARRPWTTQILGFGRPAAAHTRILLQPMVHLDESDAWAPVEIAIYSSICSSTVGDLATAEPRGGQTKCR